MKKILLVLITAIAMQAVAQRTVVSGTVISEKTGEKLSSANIKVDNSSVSVVTNEDGIFTLKIDETPNSITVSHIGYQTKRIKLDSNQAQKLSIRLTPASILLKEVVVWPENPRELIDIAIKKIPENFSQTPVLYNCFYRETAMKRQHYIYVAEGVVDMYKTGYDRNITRDRVAIIKGRRLISPKRGDTLSVKVMGGPVQPVQLDIVKNRDFLLNAEELDYYSFAMDIPATIDDRLQFVVSISPKVSRPYPLFYGKLYIDRETLSFTRTELQLDVSNKEKATNYMLVKKPAGVRFKPKELICLVDYKSENGRTHISYIRNIFRFNCDWKKRLFATSFTASCEMVITDKKENDVRPISGRTSFDSRDSFFDKVDYFLDADFWKDYNIIEPTISLDNAINKLIKRYKPNR
ncbi:MAG: carboxypeptidase-like regulatory domain-containing protein [Prevotella sp.]|nr:carboxypeptidase-like regulatory domain-containing protein [Prevotella sp.]